MNSTTMIRRDELDDCITWLNTRLRSHGGAVELVDVDATGHVEVRFEGMCCGCPYKALTMSGTVEPALRAVPGVSSVAAAGTRISEESASRLARYVAMTATSGVRYDRQRNATSTSSGVDVRPLDSSETSGGPQ